MNWTYKCTLKIIIFLLYVTEIVNLNHYRADIPPSERNRLNYLELNILYMYYTDEDNILQQDIRNHSETL